MRNSVIKKNRKVYIFKHQQTSSGGGGGGADLEDNKTATIDVSTYTGPVEITPTAGKDGMKKTTVALNNIPSGGSSTAYCWSVEGSRFPLETTYAYISTDVAPANPIEAYTTKVIKGSLQTGSVEIGDLILVLSYTYTRISDTEFTISWIDGRDVVTFTYTRDSTKDFTLW